MIMSPIDLLQVAIKNNVGVFYFNCNFSAYALLGEDGKMGKRISHNYYTT